MSATLARDIATRFERAMADRGVDALRQALAGHDCYIYGAGGFGRMVAARVAEGGYRLRGFIDTFATPGQDIDGTPCVRPDALPRAACEAGALIVAINNFRTPVAEVANWARDAGFAEILFVPELPDVLGPDLGQYWQGPRVLIRDHASDLARLETMLTDGTSRAILAGLVAYRIGARPEDHPPVDRDHQYFPLDLPMPQSAVSVVDCGAFPGDMLDCVAAAGLTLSAWYAFEPDAANFTVLCQAAARASLPAVSLFPCGVGAETGTIRFAEGGQDASRASTDPLAGAGTVVPVVRVDDVLAAPRIDLVKLDIEGFEAAAIDGMMGLLEEHRPRLAVAVYHKPADLWELAFKIEALFPGTHFALRQHGYNGYDTVLYADLPARG